MTRAWVSNSITDFLHYVSCASFFIIDPIGPSLLLPSLIFGAPSFFSGKTITVLSLILRTFGLGTEPKEESQSSEIDNDAIFDAYWNDHLTSFARQPAILKLISRLMKSDKESYYFEPPVESWLDEAPDYYDVIENPISMHVRAIIFFNLISRHDILKIHLIFYFFN